MVLFYLSASAWGGLKLMNDNIMLYLEQPITIKEAAALIEEEKEAYEAEQTEEMMLPDFCVWGQEEDILVANENLNKTTTVDAILLCGNPELVLEDCRMPVRDDKEGCIIDEETAWDLFGGSEVIDKAVTYNNRQYFIRKVIKSDEQIFACQADDASEKNTGQQNQADTQGPESFNAQAESRLNRVTLKKQEGCSVREIKTMWDNRTGIGGKVLDIELLYGISGFCVLLVPITLCAFFLIELLRQDKRRPEFYQRSTRMAKRITVNKNDFQKTGKFQRMAGWIPQHIPGHMAGKAVTAASALIIIGMILFLLIKWVEIPLDYIPTKWSDFSFWINLWREKTDAVKLLWEMPKTDLDYIWVSLFCQSAVCGILAETITIMAYTFAKHTPLS